MKWLREAFAAVIAFYLKPHPAVSIFRAGITLLVLAAAGFAFHLELDSAFGRINFNFDNTSGGVGLGVILFMGAALIVVGVIWMIIRAVNAASERPKRHIVVLEQRGLKGATSRPLADSIETPASATIHPLLVDVRQYMDTSPEAALVEVADGTEQFRRQLASLDRTSTSSAYGGLIATPFSFLTGALLDDEGEIQIFDWDRDNSIWTLIADTGGTSNGFAVDGLPKVPRDIDAVVLVVSCSYQANLPAINAKFLSFPVVHLSSKVGGTQNHWSAESQKSFAATFRETLIELNNRGVKEVHAILAAQNSVCFTLGRTYDRRNLMPITVYQYAANTPNPYPWGVRMPTNAHGPSIVR